MLLRMTYNMGALRRVSTTHLGERAVGGNIESSLKRYVKGRMRQGRKRLRDTTSTKYVRSNMVQVGRCKH